MIRLSADQLSREALLGLIQEFVTRDGTDYGAVEQALETKIAQVERQIAAGEVVIVFDPESETANLVPARDLDAGRGGRDAW